MGFRSTFVSEDLDIRWPDWFVDKYEKLINFSANGSGQIASKFEMKTDSLPDLHSDIQKAVDWGRMRHFILIYLHECGGVTRLQINAHAIKLSEPQDWLEVGDITHHYCYGCSDI